MAWSVGTSPSEVPELLPVNHMGVQVDVERLQRFLDIGDRKFRVPAVVQVDRQRAQTEVLHQPGDVGAIDSAADSYHAVVGLAPADAADLRHQGLKACLALGRRDQPLAHEFIVALAVVAHALCVKADVRVGRVHDATDAGLEFAHRFCGRDQGALVEERLGALEGRCVAAERRLGRLSGPRHGDRTIAAGRSEGSTMAIAQNT
jgi:hypothetical protein